MRYGCKTNNKINAVVVCSKTNVVAGKTNAAAVNTTTGAHLDAAKTALRQYMRAGGGFVGIHNAVGGTEYNWPYYEGLCGGTQYYDHGALQNGTVVTLARDSSTEGLPTGCFSLDNWTTFGDWMVTNGVLEEAVDATTIATNDYLPGC